MQASLIIRDYKSPQNNNFLILTQIISGLYYSLYKVSFKKKYETIWSVIQSLSVFKIKKIHDF